MNALVGYAKQAEKAVILEGIETPEDLEFARSLGVTYVQGFLFKDKFIKVRA
ncbi:MAG: EAL domain-containing protein [Psychrobium sp.]